MLIIDPSRDFIIQKLMSKKQKEEEKFIIVVSKCSSALLHCEKLHACRLNNQKCVRMHLHNNYILYVIVEYIWKQNYFSAYT